MDYKAALMALVLVSSTLAGCSGTDDDDIVGTNWYHAGATNSYNSDGSTGSTLENPKLPVIFFDSDGTLISVRFGWNSMTKKVCADIWAKPWEYFLEFKDTEDQSSVPEAWVYGIDHECLGGYLSGEEYSANSYTFWFDHLDEDSDCTQSLYSSPICNNSFRYEIRDDALIILNNEHGWWEGSPGECSVWLKVTSEVPRAQEEALAASDPSHIDSTVTLPEWCGDDEPEPEPEPEDVPGCMDAYANNYDGDATSDDGSCTYDSL